MTFELNRISSNQELITHYPLAISAVEGINQSISSLSGDIIVINYNLVLWRLSGVELWADGQTVLVALTSVFTDEKVGGNSNPIICGGWNDQRNS